jgi:transcriptional regulator with XRE-family HTH domain
MEEKKKFGFYPTHPGEVLKEEIEYRKISQRKLASDIGIIQMQYDMQMAESDKSLLSRLATIRKVAAVF